MCGDRNDLKQRENNSQYKRNDCQATVTRFKKTI